MIKSNYKATYYKDWDGFNIMLMILRSVMIISYILLFVLGTVRIVKYHKVSRINYGHVASHLEVDKMSKTELIIM